MLMTCASSNPQVYSSRQFRCIRSVTDVTLSLRAGVSSVSSSTTSHGSRPYQYRIIGFSRLSAMAANSAYEMKLLAYPRTS